MKRSHSDQHTIRGVPENIGAGLREKARREGKSVNKTAIEALRRGLGLSDEEIRFSDLDALAGTWTPDPDFDAAIAEMDKVDKELWK